MPWFNLVLGIAPDYMHGVMLGATKTLMYLWFSATNIKKPFFIGNKLKILSKRLQSMRPPDYIERLPRDLEKHYHHFKAAEYEAFLLYYGISCLQGYLPDPYLKHFASLSESIHILLGDSISNSELDRAECLSDQFYAQFADLYDAAYSGLNIHNIGCHLVDFVRKWGPLYCWSAFGFEDINGHLVKTAHGTGDVKLQLLRTKEVHGTIAALDQKTLPNGPCKDYIQSIRAMKTREWKWLLEADNCCVTGPFKKIPKGIDNVLLDKIIRETHAGSVSDLRTFQRLTTNDSKFYSKDYLRMKRRICFVVLLNTGDIVEIQYFIWNENTDMVFAYVKLLTLKDPCFPFAISGYHLLRVELTTEFRIIPITEIAKKLFFSGSKYVQAYICRMPNLYGHKLEIEPEM